MQREALRKRKSFSNREWISKVSKRAGEDVATELKSILVKKLKLNVAENDLLFDSDHGELYSPSSGKVYLFSAHCQLLYAKTDNTFGFYPCEDESLWPHAKKQIDWSSIYKDVFLLISNNLAFADYLSFGKTCKTFYKWFEKDKTSIKRLEEISKLTFEDLKWAYSLLQRMRANNRYFYKYMDENSQKRLLKLLFKDNTVTRVTTLKRGKDPKVYHMNFQTNSGNFIIEFTNRNSLWPVIKNIHEFVYKGYWKTNNKGKDVGTISVFSLFRDNIFKCLRSKELSNCRFEWMELQAVSRY